MEKKIVKIEAYAKCLQEGFVYLRQRFAMLEPMIFDEKFISERSFWDKHVGFHTVRDALIFTCAKDIANICHDGGNRVPSFRSIRRLLSDKNVNIVGMLRENYIRGKGWTHFLDGELTGYVPNDLERISREVEFDTLYTDFVNKSELLLKSKTLEAFIQVRNMVSAHTQVRFINGEYCINEIEDLGLEWDDMKTIIESMQEVVEIVCGLCSITVIDYYALGIQVQRNVSAFWDIEPETDNP